MSLPQETLSLTRSNANNRKIKGQMAHSPVESGDSHFVGGGKKSGESRPKTGVYHRRTQRGMNQSES